MSFLRQSACVLHTTRSRGCTRSRSDLGLRCSVTCTQLQEVKFKPVDSKITIARTPLQRTRTVDEQNDLEAYLGLIGGSPALQHCREIGELLRATNKHPKSYTASPADTLAIVQNIVRLSNAKRCIEIGVFTGLMTLAIATALPKDGSVAALERDASMADFGLPYWKQANVDSKIDLHVGDASDSLNNMLKVHGKHQFDLAFIDADKLNYEGYYVLCLELVRPGGVILIDNTLWGGRVTLAEYQDANSQAIRRLNTSLMEDDRVFVSVLANSDGLSMVVKKDTPLIAHDPMWPHGLSITGRAHVLKHVASLPRSNVISSIRSYS